MQLNIRHLQAVAAVVRHGGVSAAARIVNLTQPAITQGLAKLERQLGLPLFTRGSGVLTPTEAGRLLAVRAEAMQRLIGSQRATATQIRAFVALARSGSYAAAALETGLAEASLHRAVGDLAVAMGQPLVDRRGRGVVLTKQGAAIARRFRLAQAELASAMAELATLRGREVGRITVGVMPLARARLLPNAVVAFHARHPDVDVAIAEGSYVELVGPLRDAEIDLMIGALRPSAAGDDLTHQPLFSDRPVVIGRAGHPLAGRKEALTSADLTRYSWIIPPEPTPLRLLWRHMFDVEGIVPPRVPIECGSVITIRQLLLNSDFLTLLSPDQVAMELDAGWLAQLGAPPVDISRTIGVTTRADWRPTPVQASFLTILSDEALRV